MNVVRDKPPYSPVSVSNLSSVEYTEEEMPNPQLKGINGSWFLKEEFVQKGFMTSNRIS